MEITNVTYGGGDSWAAASARPRVLPPRLVTTGVEVCPQRRHALGTSFEKFAIAKGWGSSVLRPPV